MTGIQPVAVTVVPSELGRASRKVRPSEFKLQKSLTNHRYRLGYASYMRGTAQPQETMNEFTQHEYIRWGNSTCLGWI